jgi:chromosome partitioning protein
MAEASASLPCLGQFLGKRNGARRRREVRGKPIPAGTGLADGQRPDRGGPVFVPMTPDYLALEGLVNHMEAVEMIRAGIGQTADLLGILLTLCDYRLNATAEIIGMIRRHYRRRVFKTEIKSNVRLKEAPSFGKTIFDYDRGSAGAEAYRELVREVLSMI